MGERTKRIVAKGNHKYACIFECTFGEFPPLRIHIVRRIPVAVGVGVDPVVLLPEGVGDHPPPEGWGICPCPEVEPGDAEVGLLVLLAREGVAEGNPR